MLIGQSDPCRNIYDVWFCSSLQSIDLCARSLYEQTVWFKNILAEIIFDEQEENMRKYTHAANIMESFIKIIKSYKTSRHYASDAR